ncbi:MULTISPECIES: hypothetical protein [Chryseobacterium]|uniref:hypothetical protein n=1 Tax=Chryseobacterium TaxID=59732 RepID=UPI001C126E56|nr:MULTISPECIES: hypothetical protein [Chryseobacterium]MDH5034450.1 hypothetical protein [Chryseobacterium cucumeris]QWT87842.1 hypothetical protein KBP46_08380 [Chryseobacterium sp. PCH239]
MKKFVIIFFSATSLICCQNKEKNTTVENINNDIDFIKKHMRLQEKIELSENDTNTSNQYKLIDKDLELGGELTLQGLKENGYKVPENSFFSKQIKDIFETQEDCSCTSVKQHQNFTTYFVNSSQEQNIKQTEFDYTYDHIYVYPNLKILTDLPLLNDIVELKNNNLKVNLNQTIIARNKYLFNNSKGDLAWLLANDKDFLKILLVNFGFDKEDKINEVILNDLFQEYSKETPESSQKIGNILFVKNCEGKLSIRKNLLKYIEKNTTKNNDKYVSALSNYVIGILYNDSIKSLFSPDEKAEIVANISNIEIPAFNNYKGLNTDSWNSQATTLFYLQNKSTMNHPEVLDILKKHNYFGYPYLKKYIESGGLENESTTSPQDDDYQ